MKISKVYQVDRENFISIYNKSNNLEEFMTSLGLNYLPGNIAIVRRRTLEEKLDYNKFSKNNPVKKATDLKLLLVENSSINRTELKRKLLKYGVLLNECSICKLPPIWNNKKLVMVLDHINGINNDNRIENLRLLCPNCNSQTDTFAGRNKKYKKVCVFCNKRITYKYKRCIDCYKSGLQV